MSLPPRNARSVLWARTTERVGQGGEIEENSTFWLRWKRELKRPDEAKLSVSSYRLYIADRDQRTR